jgi:hypothetical protein
MDEASGCGRFSECSGSGRCREVQDAIGVAEGRSRILPDLDSKPAQSGEQPDILAERRRAGTL